MSPWRPPAPVLPKLDPLVEQVLFWGLRPSDLSDQPASAWRANAHQLIEQRLAGLALFATRGGADIPQEVVTELISAHRRQVLRTLAVNARGASLVDSLRRSGVDVAVIKGPGLDRIDPVRAERTYSDLDLLVPPASFRHALDLLRAQGLHEAGRVQVREYFNSLCREGMNLDRDDGSSIDLHHTLPPWYWGRRLNAERVIAWSEDETVAERDLPLAHPVHNLIISALHVVSDRERPGESLRVWRDVAVAAAVCDPLLVAEEARLCGLDWWVAFILGELPDGLVAHGLADALSGGGPSGPDRFRLRHLLPPSIGSRHHIGIVFRLPLPNAGAFLIGEILPSRGAIRQKLGRSAGYRDWWQYVFRRWWDALRRP